MLVAIANTLDVDTNNLSNGIRIRGAIRSSARVARIAARTGFKFRIKLKGAARIRTRKTGIKIRILRQRLKARACRLLSAQKEKLKKMTPKGMTKGAAKSSTKAGKAGKGGHKGGGGKGGKGA